MYSGYCHLCSCVRITRTILHILYVFAAKAQRYNIITNSKFWDLGKNKVHYGKCGSGVYYCCFRLRVVPIFPQGQQTAREITPREKGETQRGEPFSRGVIFTRTRVSLALLSLRKNGDYSQSIVLWKNCLNAEVHATCKYN